MVKIKYNIVRLVLDGSTVLSPANAIIDQLKEGFAGYVRYQPTKAFESKTHLRMAGNIID